MHILTSYSLILTNTVFHVQNGFSSGVDLMSESNTDIGTNNEDCFATEDLATIFTTTAPGTWFKNVNIILSRCFKRAFPKMTDWLIEFNTEFNGGAIQFDCIATKPFAGRKAYLAPRCF